MSLLNLLLGRPLASDEARAAGRVQILDSPSRNSFPVELMEAAWWQCPAPLREFFLTKRAVALRR